MRLVIDTNVLLSAVMSSVSGSAQIFALWRSRKFDLLTAAEQIEEIGLVTRYPKIRARLAPAVAGRLVNRLRDVAIVVQNLPKVDVASDPSDNYLLALAEAGQADFLVTGDKALLGLKRYKSTRIVAPSALLELLKNQGRRRRS